MIGNTLSHYHSAEKVGPGRLVYRAKDTTLSCHVAIKPLPDEFAHNAEHRGQTRAR